MRYPPTSGPRETDAAAAIDQNPRAIPRRFGGNSRVTIAMPTGIMNPAPAPWTMRNMMRAFSSQAIPHRNDPNVNRRRALIYVRL